MIATNKNYPFFCFPPSIFITPTYKFSVLLVFSFYLLLLNLLFLKFLESFFHLHFSSHNIIYLQLFYFLFQIKFYCLLVYPYFSLFSSSRILAFKYSVIAALSKHFAGILIRELSISNLSCPSRWRKNSTFSRG